MIDLETQLDRINTRATDGRTGGLHHQAAVRTRLNEVRRLLDALIFRFPSA